MLLKEAVRQLLGGAGGDGWVCTKSCEMVEEAVRSSNAGWVAMSGAAARAGRSYFGEFVRERVWGPVGMQGMVLVGGIDEPDDDHPLANVFPDLIYEPGTRIGNFMVGRARAGS